MRKIRKTQQNLVEKAEKQGFAEQNIEYLRTATCPMYTLNSVFARMQKEPQSTEVIDKLAILNNEFEGLYGDLDKLLCISYDDLSFYAKNIKDRNWDRFQIGAFCEAITMLSKVSSDRERILQYAECIVRAEITQMYGVRTAMQLNVPVEDLRAYNYFFDFGVLKKYMCDRYPCFKKFFDRETGQYTSDESGREVMHITNMYNTYFQEAIIANGENVLKMGEMLSGIAESGNSFIKLDNNGYRITAAVDTALNITIGSISKYHEKFFIAKGTSYLTCDFVQKIVIFFDGSCYYKVGEKLVPLSFKNAFKLKQSYGEAGEEVLGFLCEFLAELNDAPVLKDLLRTGNKDGRFLLPVTFNECKGVHNMNQLLKNRWKNSDRINWNRTDANLGYLILKSLPYVTDKHKGKLLQLKDCTYIPEIQGVRCTQKRYAIEFLCSFLKTTLHVSDDEYDSITVHDYVSQNIDEHIPVSIGFKSFKKLEDEHIRTTYTKNMKREIHDIKIPENSIFLALRKHLPDSFEWIKDGKRLWFEGFQMHHCVNTYYGSINNDQSAIYSFVHEGQRYTVEFKVFCGRYRIKQIQSKCNRGCPKEVHEMVKKLIKNIKVEKAA